MSSLRHTTVDGSAVDRRTGPGSKLDGYLDTARACILDVGWTRTTLTEIARRAGVSRMTIYRAWSDMPALLGDLMTREWASMTETSIGEPGEHLADRVIRTVQLARDNDLLSRIVEVDPELLLPYLLERRGRSQEGVVTVIAAGIRSGQAEGTIRAGNPLAMARALVLALHGFVLSAQTMVDDEVSASDLDHEMRQVVERMLR